MLSSHSSGLYIEGIRGTHLNKRAKIRPLTFKQCFNYNVFDVKILLTL